MTGEQGKAREFWIGITQDGFEKWLTKKNPEEDKCNYRFISSDGEDGCAEYLAVIEYSAYLAEKERADRLEKLVEELEDKCDELRFEILSID